ncbi:MAG: hypothetical protein AAF468_17110 [Pseudomonadota bacterium]
MTTQQTTDLDEMIDAEKRRLAHDYFSEAWTGASTEGIEPEILAESAIFTIFSELVRQSGEDTVGELIASLPHRLNCGEYSPHRTVQ